MNTATRESAIGALRRPPRCVGSSTPGARPAARASSSRLSAKIVILYTALRQRALPRRRVPLRFSFHVIRWTGSLWKHPLRLQGKTRLSEDYSFEHPLGQLGRRK